MFRDTLAADAVRLQAQFDRVLGGLDDLPVTRAMRHATTGGKALRGFLVLESARLHDVAEARAIWPATAIEAMHAYSLVHDDLPCMDDDDLRRGRPTVHVAWDQATAVLAGDALQALAFELAAHPEAGPPEIRAELALTLARAGGMAGMVLGQALDIAAESAAEALALEQITRLQAGKTGALIEWAATAGARLAGADPDPLRQYARALGLAFQIADDILDVEGDVRKAGKRLQKDASAGKATFVSLLGLDPARKRAAELVEAACDAVSVHGARAETLQQAARFVIARDS
ncbi:farnesyl-diphosphate synthase [Cribrihabitans marinus]|uniref:Geranylgeranyl diphosphate synthase n=1 Tax=Cribrihabitans marinus TaxID=1227549 RepID=A0A1H7DMR4_9RHOB|nr:polyprenyl synthetase family protein [Cribrihabitans marinus]GGH39269.1 farnesyl-diphosphate synthase [Cribrihabitans marinus]SEK00922.1 farnesyl-diphosphate synthase [Cribrihabitans marinus]